VAGNGYTVQPSALKSGSGLVSDLLSECEQLSASVTEAFTALAAAAGHPAVESAARGAGVTALKQFLNAGAGYQHTAQGLLSSAATYAKAESSATSAVTSIRAGGAQ
jgi:hypothetical protein